ncbi:adenine-specific DNA-methyltransferase [Candidatus Kryptonium thompsonii]|uniref:Adenine-specific DNA-methyltransferase n=1 Tax=Candidatus Kryptonium thompsonii TaxID=1633631 RepID=A0A0N7MT14_9BACT|nr:site-specific DNA-methyltransferase [Candidatus Kryptonium thompsoni]CUS79322.1 adenine-specific DNA-methyltransferase [Candidatus Kryptonium thompsoni]CUS80873.1 adenine-specific DNA-methyltransferase [Candidatus Kryptonium thompsoni]CUS83746.1 adenine-specific DNA-methyltransferase [Candidatus Kryptonium thompsoni]CUS86924.1 adenine-specific DNA-methyltransferase [Candidatus Kryptonium thompsoni]CUS87562.1 adenine-specific DNA-methyltransferase [Candidatus Kryptonium thompsoni]
MENLLDNLKALLKKDERLVSEGELLRNKIIGLALKLDKDLIKLLLSDNKMKEVFFVDIDGTLIFDKDKFIKFVSNKQFLPDSYTAFKNKIGLVDEKGEFISEKKDVVLSWPYKDCVLEGGMTKEDQKRDEIFWNEILAPDEISRLLDPKVFTNAKRIDKDGEHKFDGFRTDEKGDIKDNLIIKGNNLLVLHSLKKRFAGKVKLIYIDPPYNPDNPRNTFTYNNSFKHSTWLTFMKNRLEVAKLLLKDDGVLQIAIDENEQARLGVLIDELFHGYEKHCITIVHNPRGVQGTNFSYTNEFVYFVFKKGLKVIHKIKRDTPLVEEFRDHGGESLRSDAKNCFYPVLVKDNKIVGFGEVPSDDFHPKGKNVKREDGTIEVWPIDVKGIERKWVFARQSIDEIKDKLFVKSKDNGEIDIFRIKDEKIPRTVWFGSRYDASTHGSKIVNKIIEGKTVSFPKSLYAVYDCIYSVVKTDKEAIILDFFAGSGTTAHAVMMLNNEDSGNRKFILVEQLDEHVEVATQRIKNEIEKFGKGDFVYLELLKWNEKFVDEIKRAETKEELKKLWEQMKEKAFLSYKVDVKTIDEHAKDFEDLSIEDQKRFLYECLDKNHLYVNYSEIDDEEYGVSEEDKKLNRGFYGKYHG